MDRDVNRTSLEILFIISRELATTLDLHTVLARVLTLSTKNMGAERASLIVLSEAGKPVDAAVLFDGKLLSHTVEQMQDVVTSGLAGWVVQNQKPALLSNTHEDKRWLVRPDEIGTSDQPKSALCVPLMARNHLVGVLTIVHPQVNFFSQAQFNLQQAIADLAGIAIRNAQLYEDVQTAHHRYHDLFEDSVDPIFISTLDGRIIEGNHQAVLTTGISKDALPGIQMSDVQELPVDKTGVNFELVRAHEPLIYESKMHCKDGGNLPVEVHVSTITIAGTQFLQWIFRDISERKNLDTLREDLGAMIYHDLRSPLANIISSLEIMQSTLPFDQLTALKQLFAIANRSTERMQRLISSLLDINRLEAGQQITEKQKIDVDQLINEAVETVLPISKSRELTIEQLIPGTLPPLLIDIDMIRRVLINLLENAAKFSPQKSRILVGAKKSGDRITIWVEDHGPGIPPEAKEKIFDKFVRLRGEGMTKGLGIGLAFCRIAVQSHGGTIWVENVAEGGSRFIFTIPNAT
jgi:PAS domain S-box-containing protein